MSRRRSRGFTLIEAMVAVAVGAATVVMAAKLAAVVVQQNGIGRQKNDLSLRTRLLGEQLLSDVRLAGMGSTGAIGVDPSSPVLGAMAIPATPAGGFPAIPAIVGANNLLAQGLPTGTLAGGSDAVQLVVPNPSTLVRTVERARRATNVLTTLDASAIPADCNLLFIHDHTNPNGSGRTQVAWVQAVGPTQVTMVGQMMFTAAPGTEVMCGRISTYWVDDAGWLHRTDLGPGAAVPLGGSSVWVNGGPLEPDLLSPGVEDLQIAYKVSAEAYRMSSTPQPAPADPDASWLYRGFAPNVDGLFNPADTHLWFEIRLVRFNLFARRQKMVRGSAANTVSEPGVEDGDAVTVPRGVGGEWITFSEAVTNLRIFDSAAAAEVPAEPY